MFGLVLAFVHWGYVYLFSLHHRWAYPRVSCIVTFCVWRWILSYTGAYPHPWVHQIFCGFSHHSIYFLIFVGPTLGHTPILEFIRSLAYFLIAWSISWSLRVVTPGHTPFSAFLLGHTPSLWVYRVSCWFHGCRTHLLIFMSYHLGRRPIVILFKTSPLFQIFTIIDFHL